MKLSTAGLDLIKSFEGYLDKQPDGSCKAYRCPANVWTCGWGCTEGVTMNTHWTQAEATEKLRGELAKHEAAVLNLVKVPITQAQFDALVSFSYNVGSGALAKSTLSVTVTVWPTKPGLVAIVVQVIRSADASTA